MSDALWIVIPAYNEEETIEEVIRQWHKVADSVGGASRLLLINDGSRDGTRRIAEELQGCCPRLLVETKENGGHGAAVLYGYRFAIRHHADYIFQTDSDGQTLPEEFWQLWNDREKAGLLIGSRKHRQDGIGRVIVTNVLRAVVFLNFGVWMQDINTPFRLMRGSELAQLMRWIPRDYHLANVCVSVLYKKSKRYIGYYPITFQPRQGGKNSINIKKICSMGRRAMAEFRCLSKRYKNLG